VLDPGAVEIPATLAAATERATTAAASAAASGPAAGSGLGGLAAGFVPFVRGNPSFTHYFYWAWYLKQEGNGPATLAALREAAKYPLEIDVDDFGRHDVYAYRAAQMAYELKDFKLVLELVGRWEKRATQRERNGDASYMAFRAAAELALGDSKKATEDAEAAVGHNMEQPLWAGNLEALLQACKRGDQKFVYDPGTRVPGFEVFVKGE
jgi:tetratricopeptide (TPR) repeat protein